MWKRGGKIRSWKKRWFILIDGTLFYGESEEALSRGKSKGEIILEGCSLTENGQCAGAYFEIAHPDRRTFCMRAESNEGMLEWISALEAEGASRMASLSTAAFTTARRVGYGRGVEAPTPQNGRSAGRVL